MIYKLRKEIRNEQKKRTRLGSNKTKAAIGLAILSCIGATAIMQPVTALAAEDTSSYTTRSMSESDFLALAAPCAQQVAAQNDLYASVMIAQAILESGWAGSSLSMAPNNNLFGVKGTYNGQSVTMPTQEYVNGKWITINAAFRKYPSYKESFEDNARVLKTVSFGSGTYYYSGAWKSNTSSYKDATAWLTGRYATAPNYNTALNRLIELYNLTQYDTPGSNSNNTATNLNNDTSSSMTKGTVTAAPSLNIRATPSSSGSILGSYAYNQSIDITAQATGSTVNGTNVWYKTNKGYVSAAYVKAEQPATNTNTQNNQVSATTKTGSTDLTMNIRQSASTSAQIVGSYAKGTKINITGETTGTSVNGNTTWYKTDKGFVSAAYVSVSATVNTPTSNTNTQSNQVSATTKTGSTDLTMNIRQSASTSAQIVGSYAKGTKINITGETPGTSVNGNTTWYKTDKGFVSAAYVSVATTVNTSTTNTNTKNNQVSTTTKTGSTDLTMNIRQSASTSAQIVGSYAKGTNINITGETTGTSVNGNTKWYKTDKGFVSAAYVSVSNRTTNTSATTATDNNKTYTVKSGDSVWGISNKYKISMNDFVKWNNIKNNFLYPGQKVIIQK